MNIIKIIASGKMTSYETCLKKTFFIFFSNMYKYDYLANNLWNES